MVSDLDGPAAFRRFRTIDLEQSACFTSNVGPHPQLVQARPEDAPVLLFRGTVNLVQLTPPTGTVVSDINCDVNLVPYINVQTYLLT